MAIGAMDAAMVDAAIIASKPPAILFLIIRFPSLPASLADKSLHDKGGLTPSPSWISLGTFSQCISRR
jgi:hypothetical protein